MRKRARLLGWALIVAFPFLVLGTIEGGVRLLGIAPRFERDAAVPAWLDRNILAKESRWIDLLGAAPRDLKNYYTAYSWDRFLFYRFRPNLAIPLTDVMAPPGARERTRWVLRTNARGYPGRAATPGEHPGVFRILAAGDSSTFGWGVESDEAYPALLEAELASRNPGMRVEVVNLGVCGYSSLQGRVLIESEGLAYRPDVVIVSYGSNDWSRVPEPFDAALRRNEGWLGAARAVLHRSRAYQIGAAWLARAAAAPERARAASGGDPERLPWNVGPEASAANLTAIVTRIRSADAEPILVSNCVPGEMSGPIRAAAAGTGAPFVDTAAALESALPDVAAGRIDPVLRARNLARYGETLLAEHPFLEVYLADRCHPNPIGHRLLAAAVARAVEATTGFRRARAAARADGAAEEPSL